MTAWKRNYHWIVLISCCLMVAVSIGLFINAYGVYYTPLTQKLGVGRAAVAMHSTIAGLVTGFSMPLVVKLMKKIRLQIMIAIGCCLMVMSLVFTAFASQVWMLNVLGVVRGIGCAFTYLTLVNIVLANWFEKKYGTVVGIASSFSGLAGALLSPVFSSLVTSAGYRNTLLIEAGLVLMMVLPGILFVRLRPEELGLLPYGRTETPNKGASDLKAASTTTTQESSSQKEVHFLKLPVFWFLLIGGFFSIFVTSFSQHMSGYTESIGVGTAVGVAMLSASMIGNIAGKLLMGILIDIMGATKTVILFLLLGSVGILILLLLPTPTFLLIGGFLFGALYSVGTVGGANLCRQAFSKKQYSTAYSVMSLSGSASAALSITVIGAIYDSMQNYVPVLIGAVAFCLASVICQVLAGKVMKKSK